MADKIKSGNTCNMKDLDSLDDPTDSKAIKNKTVDQMTDDELKSMPMDAYYIRKGLPFCESVNTYSGYPYAGKHFKGVAVEYYVNDDSTDNITKEQKNRFDTDFAVIKPIYNKIFKEKFIPWLTGPYDNEKEKRECVNSLNLYNVTYYARKDNIGEMEFQYTIKDPSSGSINPVAFCIHVKGKEIIKTYGYDI